VPICNELPSSWWSPEIGLHLLLRAHITLVTWREYEALRDNLRQAIGHSADTPDGDIDAVKTQLGATDNTINIIQTQVTDI
jgi:hypothetical protein